jgi:uncharacterized repeat protein (TIGR01451 family)
MKRRYAAAGAAALGICLAGWAALGWAQPTVGKQPTQGPTESSDGDPAGGLLLGQAGPGPAMPDPGRPGERYRPVAVPGGVPGPKAVPTAQGPGLMGGDMGVMPTGPVVPAGRRPAVAAPAGPAPAGNPVPGGQVPNAFPPGVAPQQGPQGPGGAPGSEAGASGPSQFPEERGESLMADGTAGRQEPAMSLEWVGAPTAKVGQPGNYTLAVRNTGSVAVQQVQVRVRIPSGLTVAATEPRANPGEVGHLIWDLGTMQAKQEKTLQLKLVAESKGDVTPQAWVTFTGTTALRIRVREPKLTIKAGVADKVLVGDSAAFTLTVSNPGDGSADQVRIHAVLSEGLEHARGNKIDFEIGNLAAGESRNVTLLCGTRTAGAQKCEASAEAEGGLRAQDAVSVNVIMPRLDLQLVGPALRYLGRKAVYTVKVTNPGDAPAANVTVGHTVPEGFKVLAASDGGRHDYTSHTVSWFLGEIGPGQTREVHVEVQAVTAGDFKHKAGAVGARGLRAEAELGSRVEGLSALLLEMVDTEDPIEVNSDTAYEVRITNTGSKVENDIKLIATIPDKMEFKGAQGPARFREEGKLIVFEPLEKLAPRADAIFRINVKATEAGTVRFKIQMTSQNLVEPVIKMEATRIYSDAPDAHSQISETPQH